MNQLSLYKVTKSNQWSVWPPFKMLPKYTGPHFMVLERDGLLKILLCVIISLCMTPAGFFWVFFDKIISYFIISFKKAQIKLPLICRQEHFHTYSNKLLTSKQAVTRQFLFFYIYLTKWESDVCLDISEAVSHQDRFFCFDLREKRLFLIQSCWLEMCTYVEFLSHMSEIWLCSYT